MVKKFGLEVAGPLEPFADGFAGMLESEGYAFGGARQLVLLLAHLSRWLEEQGLGAGDLTAEVVETFIAEHRSCHRWCRSARSLGPLLAYLGSIDMVGEEIPMASDSLAEALLAEFRCHLISQRGFAPSTVEQYVRDARKCLGAWWPDGLIDLKTLDAPAIIGLLHREANRLGSPPHRGFVTAMRCLLRFLYSSGRVSHSLVEAVPGMARKGPSIPRAVSTEVATKVLQSCDTDTVIGRRDFAILKMLCRLGLRVGEVAGMALGDIDWRAGELTIVGKGPDIERLPLPCDVGEAIVAYLTGGRHNASSRALFLPMVAPHRSMTSNGVAGVVRKACDRAGVAPFGPHRLRHMAATETLRAGASLTEVAELLRHRNEKTSAVYARVEEAALEGLARPWPAVVA